ncbi:uncharacterized protein LOC116617568 [Nematostella vectensis]|uniref:uncharacterized protein LOC116617568 n=1 Tax=Nematostella vectensis TaxID=45351 RepID=UPI0013903C61|nr:uncharacterized protein LOC116617568 [Nematostella vectensis]
MQRAVKSNISVYKYLNMADMDMLADHLPDSHWQRSKGEESDFKSYRLARHVDKGSGAFLYLAQQLEGDDNIYQLNITDTKGGDPLRDLNIAQLKVKDGNTIIGILCDNGECMLRKE